MTNYSLCCLQMKGPFCGPSPAPVWAVNSDLTRSVAQPDLFSRAGILYYVSSWSNILSSATPPVELHF